MKKVSLCSILLILYGCGMHVNYVYRHHEIPSSIKTKEATSFGVVVYGEAITGVAGIVQNDLEKFFDRKVNIISEVKSADDTEEINLLDYRNRHPDIQFLFVIKQSAPVIHHDHYQGTETTGYDQNQKGQLKAHEVDVDYYSTTFTVLCDILLFDMPSCERLAESKDKFSKRVEFKEVDYFSNDSLFGKIEDSLKSIKDLTRINPFREESLEKYPPIRYLHANVMADYFFVFLEKLL